MNVENSEVKHIEDIITPGQLVRKRFLRNKLAIVGLIIIIFMFLFSFIGPFFSPYGEYEMFYKEVTTTNIYFITGDNELYSLNSGTGTVHWKLDLPKSPLSDPYIDEDGNLFLNMEDNKIIKIDPKEGTILESLTSKPQEAIDKPFTLISNWPDNLNIYLEDGYIVADSKDTNVKKWDFTGFSPMISQPICDDEGIIYSVSEDGELYAIKPDRGTTWWSFPSHTNGPYTISIGPMVVKTLHDRSLPSKEHLLGTDKMGLDVLTRLMYGGRISLLVGFVVIAIEMFIGILLGGIAGYYGKWVDTVIMRVVDVFNCIPYLPVLLIISSIMISLKVTPQQKIYILMLFLGFLGWASVARMVRGQILSLREQEYIVAAEATGLRPMRKIMKHLIPNVMPQLIVIATLGIGSVILTESALSYLGMGLSFPYASWGNMVDAVNDRKILTSFLNIWVPPGVCILLTVMAFNFIGDGLRDAFDPKMKR